MVPVSAALANAMQLTIPIGASGVVGFANTGYYGKHIHPQWSFFLTRVALIGIKVTAGTRYKVSFSYRFPISSSFIGMLTVGLQTMEGQVLAASQVPVCGSQTSWENINAILIPTTTSPSTANLFTITLDGDAAAGQTINFAMLSLFPPTFNDRPNGMRLDIAQVCLCALQDGV